MRKRRGFKPEFGRWVREQRLRRRESQMELAGRLDISASYLSQIEHGLVPEKPVLEAMLEAADMPQSQRREWLSAAGYDHGEATPQAETSPGVGADRVSEEYVTYQAEVTVRRDTGEIIQIKPLTPRPRRKH